MRVGNALSAVGAILLTLCSRPTSYADDAVFAPAGGIPPVVESKATRQLLEDYLKAQGWQEGDNTKTNGERFFVTTGIAVIQAPKQSVEYVDSRVMAYEAALARAKQQMLDFLEIRVTTETVLDVKEGQMPNLEHLPKALSLWDKTKMLTHAKLDQMLKKEGIDPNRQKGKEDADKVAKSSEEFRRLIRSTAKAMTSGLQPFYVIENIPSGSKGEIGVVVVYSDKLAAMAYALSTDQDMPRMSPKTPLVEQIGTNIEKLVSSFGVSQRIDERGEYCLVAFGQSAPVSESEQARIVAERKAKIQALGSLRSFAGEMVTSSDDLLMAQTTKEYDDLTASYKNESAFHSRIEAKATQLGISGAEILRRWNGRHPINGRPVVGIVMVWSPSRSGRAHGVANQMRQNVGAGTAGQRIFQGQNTNGVTSPGYKASGVEGDKDSL